MRGILLYTPGHSPYTDTLIAYGLAYALRDAPELELRGRGTHYEVLVEAEIEDVATCIRRVFRERAVARGMPPISSPASRSVMVRRWRSAMP